MDLRIKDLFHVLTWKTRGEGYKWKGGDNYMQPADVLFTG